MKEREKGRSNSHISYNSQLSVTSSRRPTLSSGSVSTDSIVRPVTKIAIVRNFLYNTSIKGIPHMLKSKYKISRFVWFTSTVLSFGLAGFFIYFLLKPHLQYEITTRVSAEQNPPLKTAEFPALTLCTTILNGLKYAMITYYENELGIGNQIRCIFPDIDINNGRGSNGTTGSKKFNAYNGRCPYKINRINQEYPKDCLSIHPPRNLTRVSYMVISTVVLRRNYSKPLTIMDSNLIFFVQTQNTLPESSRAGRIMTNYGEATEVHVRRNLHEKKSDPYSNCTTKDNEETYNLLHSDGSVLATYNYSQEACRLACLSKYTYEICNCIDSLPYLVFDKNSSENLLKYGTNQTCWLGSGRKRERNACTKERLEKYEQCYILCPAKCSHVEYHMTGM